MCSLEISFPHPTYSGHGGEETSVELYANDVWSRQTDIPEAPNTYAGFYHSYSTATVEDVLYLFGQWPKLFSYFNYELPLGRHQKVEKIHQNG